MPKLSIITINKNNAKGLKKTIESVVNQTSKDFEYIIIDGSSTDESVEIIKSFTDIPEKTKVEIRTEVEAEFKEEDMNASQAQSTPPITYWLSESDSGIYNAMNKGIKVAKGEYCQFLNSGDYLVSDNVIAVMVSEMNSCDILYGNLLKKISWGIYKDRSFAGKKPSMMNFYTSTLNHSPAFIKRILFDKYGLYDESLQIVSDWKFYIKVIIFGNAILKYKDIDVTIFNLQGISSTNNKLVKKERRKVLETFLHENIIVDYERYAIAIKQYNRINQFKVTKILFLFTERCLFMYEKIKIRLKSI